MIEQKTMLSKYVFQSLWIFCIFKHLLFNLYIFPFTFFQIPHWPRPWILMTLFLLAHHQDCRKVHQGYPRGGLDTCLQALKPQHLSPHHLHLGESLWSLSSISVVSMHAALFPNQIPTSIVSYTTVASPAMPIIPRYTLRTVSFMVIQSFSISASFLKFSPSS